MTTTQRIISAGASAPSTVGRESYNGPGTQVVQLAARLGHFTKRTNVSTDTSAPTQLVAGDANRQEAVVLFDPINGTNGTDWLYVGTDPTDTSHYMPIAAGQTYVHRSVVPLYGYSSTASLDAYVADEVH